MSPWCPGKMCALRTIRGKTIWSCLILIKAVSWEDYLISLYFCQPFDEDYLNHLDPPVKHMSFHAYLRKLTGGADKYDVVLGFFWRAEIHKFWWNFNRALMSCRGKFAALENISCKIKSGCEGHPPWPEGICTKCQPSAITLNRQVWLSERLHFVFSLRQR